MTTILSVDELAAIFIDAFQEVISTSTGIQLDTLSSGNDNEFYELTGIMNLNSNVPGILFISVSHATAQALCSYMTGVSKDEISKDDYIDALCEIANMTAGNAKLRLGNSGYLFTLSSPFVIEGSQMSIFTKKKVRVISTSFGKDELSAKMKIVY